MAEGHEKPIYKPSTPFNVSLPGVLLEGKSIFIIGRVLKDAKRCHVNLQCGSGSEADVALHFNPRFDKAPAYIVYNSREKNNWGAEKTTPDCPFLQDQQFILEILVTTIGYKISVNGKHLMDFDHRIPLTSVDNLDVDNMVKVDFFVCQSWNQTTSYKKVILDVLKPGQDILVYGISVPDCKRIEINLRHRYGIAFHYLSRFEENAIVRNTFENGKWGAEERSADIPFKHGQFFQLKISCKADKFEVFVNEQQTHTYKHRFTKLEDIDVFEVCGGLRLFSVIF